MWQTYISRLSMQLEQFRGVEFGSLEDLGFPDVDVLEGVDALAGLLDLTTNCLGNELLDELLEVDTRCFPRHDLEHLLANLPDLAGLCVRRLSYLVLAAFGEGNGE